jgi:hypothetical protein
MNRQEFEHLRDLPGKRVTADIVWTSPPGGRPNLVFDQVVLENSAEWDVVLNGTYKPGIPSVTFNFVLRGIGAICRVDVNSTVHGDAGRTHKHDLRDETDPRANLPHAAARPDLTDKSAREVWLDLCQRAKIKHTGIFNDPPEL